MSNEGNKTELIKKEEENMISPIDQTGVETAVEKFTQTDNAEMAELTITQGRALGQSHCEVKQR